MAVELEFPPVDLDPLHIITGIERCPFPQYHGLLDVVSPTAAPIIEKPDGSFGVNRFYPKGGPDWEVPEWLVPAYSSGKSPTRYASGKFTGEMRKVVQYLSGQGIPIHYDYGWYRTHGIYTAGDNSKWLIEVSGDKGILTKPLPTCPSQAPPPAELGYHPVSPSEPFPSGDALEAAIIAGDVIRLADVDRVAVFYNRNAYFSACGWAFSASGTLISNTCWDWPDQWKRGYYYTLRILEANNMPDSVIIAETASGILYGGRQNNIKFPHEERGTLLSFDTDYGASAPASSGQDTPVYVYYDGETPVVIAFQMAIPDGLRRWDNFPDWTPGQQVSPIKCDDLPLDKDVYGARYEEWNSGDSYTPAAPHLYQENINPNGTKSGRWQDFPSAIPDPRPFSFLGFPTGYDGIFPRSVFIGYTLWDSATKNDLWYYGVQVPFFDREAVYLYERNVYDATIPFYTQVQALYGDGQGYEYNVIEDDPDNLYYANLSQPKGNPDWYGDCINCLLFDPPMPTNAEEAKTPTASGNERTQTDLTDVIENGNLSTLRLLASGGIDTVVRTATDDAQFNPYERFDNDSNTSLFLGVWRDDFNGRLFATSAMNSLAAPYTENTSGYPINDLTKNSYAKAWLGVP